MPGTALVLSAGGMFGAYQAGAWKVLARYFEPGLVVGSSIGALNGWIIASRCEPDSLIDTWMHLPQLSRYNLRLPRRLTSGILDSRDVEALVRQIHSRFTPQIDYAMVLTETSKIHPRILCGPELTWQHLAASVSILGLFDQHRIERRLYCDGGLLSPLPLWAAVKLGAERIIAVNSMPLLPNVAVRTMMRGVRLLARFHPEMPQSIEVIQIAPSGHLGSARDLLCWKRENAARWIEQGQTDALAACAQIKFKGREVHV